MDIIIFWAFVLIILLLNVAAFNLYKNGKLNLIFSGIIMLFLAPVFGVSSGALFLHLVAGAGEGAGYGGAFLGLITLVNGAIILVIGIILWLVRFFKSRQQK
ncbi:inner-membrane translocator [Parageobacillus toebii]|uniref:inner-membrane translocator n=1 Tax=Parageobacillus toebii TaxID=153151 RepID=UPI0035B556EB